MEVSVYEAKSRLSQMIKRALAGETVIITHSGNPVVQLTPIVKSATNWVGMDAGKGSVSAGFFESLNEDDTIKHLSGKIE